MGVIDIIYQELRDFAAAAENVEIQKALAKKTYRDSFSLFYYDWITFRDAGPRVDFNGYIEIMLDNYANIMLQMLSKIGGTLSISERDELVAFVTDIRSISARIQISEMVEIIENVNRAADHAKRIYEG